MKRLLVSLLAILCFVVLIAFMGSIALEQFPTLVPIWEELKMQATALYNMSLVKYGAVATILIIFAIFIVVGSSQKG
ncbi:hypothetical protein ABC382_00450 [Lysinibacillus sp. 1P01SD]|uniref:hypothetical protein n=1 Tax=Lysinibacillus sp. 1P01SD TaxID=3132285 RepID=UPI0039A0A469